MTVWSEEYQTRFDQLMDASTALGHALDQVQIARGLLLAAGVSVERCAYIEHLLKLDMLSAISNASAEQYPCG